MRSSRALGMLAGTAAIAFATLVVASPAAAATLPDGQKITIVEWVDASEPVTGQFFDVNPADAASTPVGTASDENILGVEVNDEGIGAAIGQLDNEPAIWSANAVTGSISDPRIISLNGQVELDDCSGIDLVNGTFIVACSEGGGGGSHVGAVDPATGVLTPFLSLFGEELVEFDALASNPVTGQLWGFAEDANVSSSYTIDLENDVVTEVAPMDALVFAADFDRDGQLFVSTQELFGGEIWLPALAVADPLTGAYSFIEPYVSTVTDAALLFVASLTIWGAPEPALAATGASVADLLPIGLGSALLLLAGAAFFATARMQRKSA